MEIRTYSLPNTESMLVPRFVITSRRFDRLFGVDEEIFNLINSSDNHASPTKFTNLVPIFNSTLVEAVLAPWMLNMPGEQCEV